MILVHAHALVFSAFSKSTRSACTCTIPGALKSVHHKVFESTFTWRSIGNWFHVENFGTIHNDRSDAESFCKRDGIIRVYEVDAARHQMSKWKKKFTNFVWFCVGKGVNAIHSVRTPSSKSMKIEDENGIHLLSTSASVSWRLFSCRRSLMRALASTTFSASVRIRPRSCARATISGLLLLIFGMSLPIASSKISHSSITCFKCHASSSLVMLVTQLS